MLVLAVLSKVFLVSTKKIDIGSGWIMLLTISQIILLVVTLIGYMRKIPSTKYLGIAASLSLVFMFTLTDVIIGIINFLFTIDQGYIIKAITAGKKFKTTISDKITKDK